MALPVRKTDPRVSIAEYLRREEASDVRHEYHNGEMLEMSGGTLEHAAVAINLTTALNVRLREGPCRPLDSNMRVAVESSKRFVYPDASVVCDTPRFHPDDPNRTTLINPRVIFEVLSESTEIYDRNEKFDRYCTIPTFEEYVLLAQDRPAVDGFLRQPDGLWSLQRWRGLDEIIRVRCLGLDLPMTELYRSVELRDEAESQK